jgi:hypothetical protein
MSEPLRALRQDETTETSGMENTSCPKCGTHIEVDRSAAPHIDECGFESYKLECHACGTPIGVLVDPADDTLLVSEIVVFGL